MPDPNAPLHTELTRLLNLLTEARANGNDTLAALLTDAAAKCLVKMSEPGNAWPALSPVEPQPSVQQQQQIQPDSGIEENDESGPNKN